MKLRLFKASVQNGFMSRPAHMKKRVMKDPTASCPGDPALMNTNSVVIRNLLRRASQNGMTCQDAGPCHSRATSQCSGRDTHLRAISTASHHQ